METNCNKITNIPQTSIIEYPLVSIILISYNSSKYILETLESAKAQTYQKIELIVSDDCSTDNTIEICSKWIEENKHNFISTKLIIVEENTGVAANCNRGVNAAKGEWIKLTAGDDILLPNSISDNVRWIRNKPDIKILFSDVFFISDEFLINQINQSINYDNFFDESARYQYRKLLISNKLLAPSAFLNKRVIKTLGGFDERIRNMEDYPFWIKATKFGIKLYFMPITTVKYRIHSESLSPNFRTDKLYNELLKTFYLYQLPNITVFNCLYIWNIYIGLISSRNKYRKIFKLLSPVWYVKRITRINKSI